MGPIFTYSVYYMVTDIKPFLKAWLAECFRSLFF